MLKNTQASARDVRDASAKALYSRLFSWLVNTANALMQMDRGNMQRAENMRQIGVLDIFGFETLRDYNGLEQV